MPSEAKATKTFNGTKRFPVDAKRILRFFQDNYSAQPTYFDEHNRFWEWDFENKKWIRSDETAIFVSLMKTVSNPEAIVKPHVKAQALNALRAVSRLNAPIPAAKTWVQFKEIIIDFETGKQFPATHEYFITNPIPHALGKSKATPLIDKFFKEWVVGGDQNESWTETLRELCAYTMLSDQPLQVLFALVGGGSNGKSEFARFLRRFVGESNSVATDLRTITEGNFGTFGLYKKLLAVVPEVSESDLRNTNALKQVTGEDPCRIEQKYCDSFDYKNYATLVCLTNSLPLTPDKTDAFYRRWITIDFPNKFDRRTCGKSPVDMVSEAEMENFCLKMVDVVERLLKHGIFTNAGEIADRLKRYEERSDPVGQFMRENFEADESEKVIFSRVYAHFSKWLAGRGYRDVSSKKFGIRLADLGFESERHYDHDSKRNIFVVWGIKEKKGFLLFGE
jgi:P4 family phage/plasmid primase-like protien